MTIKSIQKVIKVGDSLAVTLPARDARAAGLKVGSEVQISAELITPLTKPDRLVSEYDEFVAQYGQTLKNLKDR